MRRASVAPLDREIPRSLSIGAIRPTLLAATNRIDSVNLRVIEMRDLSSALSNIPAVRGRAPWPNHEYVMGWGVFGLPFDSGHVLALRVFPENDFGPYRTLWHRDPSGRWSIYVDGSRLDTACPRYYGAACDHAGYAHIDLTWTGSASLQVTMDSPSLEWTLTASSTHLIDVINPSVRSYRWPPGARHRLSGLGSAWPDAWEWET